MLFLAQKLQPGGGKAQGRLTNQLHYMKTVLRACWRHHYAWPFHKPVDPVALNIPVSSLLCVVLSKYCVHCYLVYKDS